jgi:hypothetical protein
VLNETMPAVQPKAKMMPAFEVCQLVIRAMVITMYSPGRHSGTRTGRKAWFVCQPVIHRTVLIILTF